MSKMEDGERFSLIFVFHHHFSVGSVFLEKIDCLKKNNRASTDTKKEPLQNTSFIYKYYTIRNVSINSIDFLYIYTYILNSSILLSNTRCT